MRLFRDSEESASHFGYLRNEGDNHKEFRLPKSMNAAPQKEVFESTSRLSTGVNTDFLSTV
jgi:hypothetical protein